jgi:ABC-type multidrug transport system fused ATPase/permease subunit
MRTSLVNHKWALFTAGVMAILVYRYFTVAAPLILRGVDDWKYFGTFETYPLPTMQIFNPTRLFQENFLPTSGYLSAFFIYPVVGDYLTAASMTLAIFISLFVSALFIVLYRFFHTLCADKKLALLLAVMNMAMCFAIFKDNPANNVHMFHAREYNLYWAYVFPNILNSIFIVELMRYLLTEGNLSIVKKNLGCDEKSALHSRIKAGWLLVGLYFCVFSTLFSAGALLFFVIAATIQKCFFGLRLKKGWVQAFKKAVATSFKQYNIAYIVIFATAIVMVMEANSPRSRYAGVFGESYSGSLFSGEFLKRLGDSAYYFFLHVRSINKYVFVIMTLIFVATAVQLYRSKKTGRPASHPALALAITCVLAAALLFLFYLFLAAKAGPVYLGQIRCS